MSRPLPRLTRAPARVALVVAACALLRCHRGGGASRAPGAAQPPALLLLERARHPMSEPQDLYKAAYQACLGPEHDLGDRAAARARIVAELASLGVSAGAVSARAEPLLEPLLAADAPEPVARVNLRPLVARGAPAAASDAASAAQSAAIDALLDAMFAARPASAAGRACLARTWGAMVPHLGDAGRTLDASLAARGYPAVHHTEVYRRAYAPAYRVAPVAALSHTGLHP